MTELGFVVGFTCVLLLLFAARQFLPSRRVIESASSLAVRPIANAWNGAFSPTIQSLLGVAVA